MSTFPFLLLSVPWLLLFLGHPSFAAPEGMIQIPGGTFQMGCGGDCPMEDAKPVHRVEVSTFWIDETPVTNAQFLKFVEATKYRTVAERAPKAADFPGVPKEKLVPGSAVFCPADVGTENPYAWWTYTNGAYWRRPEGPKSADAAKAKRDFPVVHVAYEDAASYCQWASKELPTEAEYEFAARGGLAGKKFAWGDELKPGGKWMANIWQGKFPKKDMGEDGHRGLSPVKAFPPNGYGLYDMAGNVWHWCKDWYRPETYELRAKAGEMVKNPTGPLTSHDPSEPGVPKRVQKGGSFLCSDQYCIRYLVGARGRGAIDSAASNLGFRCVKHQVRLDEEAK